MPTMIQHSVTNAAPATHSASVLNATACLEVQSEWELFEGPRCAAPIFYEH